MLLQQQQDRRAHIAATPASAPAAPAGETATETGTELITERPELGTESAAVRVAELLAATGAERGTAAIAGAWTATAATPFEIFHVLHGQPPQACSYDAESTIYRQCILDKGGVEHEPTGRFSSQGSTSPPTGNVGSALVRALAEAGEKVVAVSRGEKPVRLPEGVDHRRADLGNPDRLVTAAAGGEALFLLLSGELGVNGPGSVRYGPRDRGGRCAAGGTAVLTVGTHPPDESGVHTLGRTRSGTSCFECGVDDSAAGGFYANTFAWAESVREQARDLAAALDEPISFTELTRTQALSAMTEFMPEPVAETTLSILGTPTPDELRISPDIETVLGRAATPFADWATRNIAAFR
jgi:hypothetical protein